MTKTSWAVTPVCDYLEVKAVTQEEAESKAETVFKAKYKLTDEQLALIKSIFTFVGGKV